MDKETFIKKLLLYKDTVFRVAYSYTGNRSDAEDISQEVFLKFYTSAPEISNEREEKAWLIRVTVNRSKDLIKSTWFSKRTDETEISRTYEMSECQSDVMDKVMSLPEKYRILIHLYYFEEYHINEISGITGIKPSTIQTRLQRGRKILEKKFREDKAYEKSTIQFGYEQSNHE